MSSREHAAHLAHCNQGEWEGSCKYGEPGCPAMATEASAARGWSLFPRYKKDKPIPSQPEAVHRPMLPVPGEMVTIRTECVIIRQPAHGPYVVVVETGLSDGLTAISADLVVADSDPIYGRNADQSSSGRPAGVTAEDWSIWNTLRERSEKMCPPVHVAAGALDHVHVCVVSVDEMAWLVGKARKGIEK